MNTSNSVRNLVAALGLAAASVVFVQWRPTASAPAAPLAPTAVEVVSAENSVQAEVAANPVSPRAQVSLKAPSVTASQRTSHSSTALVAQGQERKLEEIKSGEYAVNLVEDDAELAYQLGQDLASIPAEEVAKWKALRAEHAREASELASPE